MNGLHAHRLLSAWKKRRDAIQEVETLFESCAPGQAGSFHQELPFFRLLLDKERARVQRLFSRELAGDPLASSATEELRIGWDSGARAFLGRILVFLGLVERLGLLPDHSLTADMVAAALVLTANSSLVVVGPPGEYARRAYWYQPIRGDGVVGAGLLGMDRLHTLARLGSPLRIGRLRSSPARMLAIDLSGQLDGTRSLELGPLGRPVNGSLLPSQEEQPMGLFSRPQERGALDYQVQLSQWSACPASQRPLLECEILASALHLQEHVSKHGEGRELSQVAELLSVNGTRYVVQPRSRSRPGLDILRLPRQGEAARLEQVCIEPQRVVQGAPLLFFVRDSMEQGGEVLACCTSEIKQILVDSEGSTGP